MKHQEQIDKLMETKDELTRILLQKADNLVAKLDRLIAQEEARELEEKPE